MGCAEARIEGVGRTAGECELAVRVPDGRVGGWAGRRAGGRARDGVACVCGACTEVPARTARTPEYVTRSSWSFIDGRAWRHEEAASIRCR